MSADVVGVSALEYAVRGAVLLAMASVLHALLRRPALRHLAWSACGVLLLLMPFAAALMSALPLPAASLALPSLLRVVHDEARGVIAVAVVAGTGIVVWAFGTGLLLVRLARGLGTARRLVRDAQPVHDRAVRALFADAQRALGVRRPVRLLVSQGAVSPFTIGVRRPAVVLPPRALGWPVEALRAVLLHELAHVRRNDWPAQLVVAVAAALHWPNPLSHLARRLHRDAAEHASDEMAIRAGASPSAYATALLTLARGPRIHSDATAAAVGRSPLEARIRAILAPARAPAASPAAGGVVLALAFGAGLLLAGARLEAEPIAAPAFADAAVPVAHVDWTPDAALRPVGAWLEDDGVVLLFLMPDGRPALLRLPIPAPADAHDPGPGERTRL